MPHVGFADVGHWRRTAHNKISFILHESPTPAVRALGIKGNAARIKKVLFFTQMSYARYAGVGDSCKTELVLLCAVLLQCPTSAKPTLGIKGIKAAGIKQRVILLASLFL